ncbi:hypothetical protein L873DRAFT_1682209 [Choiromyces venosus 120613-1]|uniref:Altered inheritance of mitochondria protein 6 n=1 Tax=Choiromyces venosus 120613-1 TaxID=1336337 RepID=A0A3N4JRJ6_9PEZI|nr:hypothetical protein L873DRAFT_1682209 [Choiromyces venosus 120613-1]
MLAPKTFVPRTEWVAGGGRYTRLGKLIGGFSFFVLFVLCATQLFSIATTIVTTIYTTDLQTLLLSFPLSKSTYPTSLTRDILPKPIHSHNDYWRLVPAYTAISYGCISIEADVWEYDGELFIGHDVASLSRNRTFKSLYVDPLREMLDLQNPDTEFTHPPHSHPRFGAGNGEEEEEKEDVEEENGDEDPVGGRNGIWDVDPGQTTHLFVDFKTPGHNTLPVVIAHLEALRTPVNYLTHFNGTHVVHGQVTVHLTGDAPFLSIIANTTYRDYFYDAPLRDLASGRYTPENTIVSSGQFGRDVGSVIWGRGMTEGQKEIVRTQIEEAHRRGIMVRYWDTPGWPVSVRNAVWGVLVQEGVDLLNADDLKAASYLDW